jgi:hypothetical protein
MTWKKVLALVTIPVILAIAGGWIYLQLAYARIERLTERYGPLLTSAIARDIVDVKRSPVNGLGDPKLEYFKVFEYTQTRAQVFVVTRFEIETPGSSTYERTGEFYKFVLENGTWRVDTSNLPEVVWSRLGSADGQTWPPYR